MYLEITCLRLQLRKSGNVITLAKTHTKKLLEQDKESRNLDIRKTRWGEGTVPNREENGIGQNVRLFIRKITKLKQIKPKFQYNVKK